MDGLYHGYNDSMARPVYEGCAVNMEICMHDTSKTCIIGNVQKIHTYIYYLNEYAYSYVDILDMDGL